MTERFLNHVRSLWGNGWLALTPLPLIVWPVYCLGRGELRWELIALLIVVPVLAFTSPGTKKLFVGIYPLGMVGMLYDSMRFFKNVGITPARVHDCDLHAHELSLFSVTSGGVKMTFQDWFQSYPDSPSQAVRHFLDFTCAIPYGTFLYVSILFAAFLYRRDYTALRRYAWTFFALNVAGFITYHVYPAAPPWYFHAHGCAVDLLAKASEGPSLARVDAALGVRYFGGFYGRSNDIFGAMPSLHVAYPLLIVLEGYKHFRAPLRVASILYAMTMVFAAVYLDHHWVLDVLAGLVYCSVIHGGFRWVFARRSRGPDAVREPEPALARS
jgi:hypothetical protein